MRGTQAALPVAPCQSGKFQLGVSDVGSLIGQALPFQQARIEADDVTTAGHPFVDEAQGLFEMGILAQAIQAREIVLHQGIDGGRRGSPLAAGLLTQTGGEIGLPTGPVKDARQELAGNVRIGTKRRQKRAQIVVEGVEVRQPERATNVVRRGSPGLDEFVGCRHANKAEGQTLEGRLFRAAGVETANGGK
ncbi:MAG: hypothetical protein IPJ73_21140 [Zoogloea sp.]|nr:hypothetical protein [Zoogloea sp.]